MVLSSRETIRHCFDYRLEYYSVFLISPDTFHDRGSRCLSDKHVLGSHVFSMSKINFNEKGILFKHNQILSNEKDELLEFLFYNFSAV